MIKVKLFYGAGWSWPYLRFIKYRVTLFFHCKRGLYISLGWDEQDRQWKKKWAKVPAEEKAEIVAICEELIKEIDRKDS
jgi:hypothetical protein